MGFYWKLMGFNGIVWDFRGSLMEIHWTGFGKWPNYWGFVSHHFQVSVGDDIPNIYG